METNASEVREKNSSSIPDLEVHLGYVLRQVSNHVSGAFARALRSHQTSVAEWVVMCHLQSRQGTSPSDLAEALSFTRGAISKVLVKLESKDWIARQVRPDDNRAQLLSLTRSGRRVLPQLIEIADRNDQKQFHCLTEAERVTLRRTLRKLTDLNQIKNVPVD